jgi:hypothetical protein
MPIVADGTEVVLVVLASSGVLGERDRAFGQVVVRDPLQLMLDIYNRRFPFQSGPVLLRIRSALDLDLAYDVGEALSLYRSREIKNIVTCYADTIDLAIALVMAHSDVRLAPPFVGPLFWGISLSSFQVGSLIAGLGAVTMIRHCGDRKIGPEAFAGAMNGNEAFAAIATLAQEMERKAFAIISEKVPAFSVSARWYACTQDLKTDGFLTATIYYEEIWHTYRLRLVPHRFLRIFRNLSRLVSIHTRQRSVWIVDLDNAWSRVLFGPPIELDVLEWFRPRLGRLPHALILIVRHNGGSFANCDRLATLLASVRSTIPVYVFVRRAISAGCMFSLSSGNVWISPFGRIGGIGTYSVHLDLKEKLKSIGVESHASSEEFVYRYGPFAFGTSAAFGDAQQRLVDLAYTRMIEHLREHTTVREESLQEIERGTIFFGDRAIDVGLANAEGSFVSLLEHVNSGGKKSPLSFRHVGPRSRALLPLLVRTFASVILRCFRL